MTVSRRQRGLEEGLVMRNWLIYSIDLKPGNMMVRVQVMLILRANALDEFQISL